MRGVALPVENLPNLDSQGFIEATPPPKGRRPRGVFQFHPCFRLPTGGFYIIPALFNGL